MTVTKKLLAAAFGVCLASSTQAKEPAKLKLPEPTTASATVASVSNQELANSVATRLRFSGLGTGADIKINTQAGVVEISGTVPNKQHSDAVVDTIKSVPGVTKIVNTLVIGSSFLLTPVSGANDPMPTPLPMGPMGAITSPITPLPTGMPMGMGGGMGMMPGPMGGGVMQGAFHGNEPAPMQGPNGPAYDPYGPKLPPYAWPTYAPYPNQSRVAYPESYPYNAFPFIGPFYPYPKVPLGWRSVQLQWEDGHWYYGRVSTPHDYWRVRFW